MVFISSLVGAIAERYFYDITCRAFVKAGGVTPEM
jgi:hypothetical protein